jgi:hypothetical protein
MMRSAKLRDHVSQLLVTVVSLGDPPPAGAIDLFNKLLADARSSSGPRSLVHEIPDQGTDAGRDELILWTSQLWAALGPQHRIRDDN